MSVQPTTETGELRSLIVPATAAWLRRATGTATLTLEIGCGPGQYRLAVNGRYIGVDRTAEPYREGLPRLVDAVAAAAALPFRNGVFDLVFYSNVFHLFTDGSAALRQAVDLLKPGGVLLLFDYTRPTLATLKRRYAEHGWHAEIRSCRQWLALCRQAGLVDARIRWNRDGLAFDLFNAVPCAGIRHRILDRVPGSILISGDKR